MFKLTTTQENTLRMDSKQSWRWVDTDVVYTDGYTMVYNPQHQNAITKPIIMLTLKTLVESPTRVDMTIDKTVLKTLYDTVRCNDASTVLMRIEPDSLTLHTLTDERGDIERYTRNMTATGSTMLIMDINMIKRLLVAYSIAKKDDSVTLRIAPNPDNALESVVAAFVHDSSVTNADKLTTDSTAIMIMATKTPHAIPQHRLDMLTPLAELNDRTKESHTTIPRPKPMTVHPALSASYKKDLLPHYADSCVVVYDPKQANPNMARVIVASPNQGQVNVSFNMDCHMDGGVLILDANPKPVGEKSVTLTFDASCHVPANLTRPSYSTPSGYINPLQAGTIAYYLFNEKPVYHVSISKNLSVDNLFTVERTDRYESRYHAGMDDNLHTFIEGRMAYNPHSVIDMDEDAQALYDAIQRDSTPDYAFLQVADLLRALTHIHENPASFVPKLVDILPEIHNANWLGVVLIDPDRNMRFWTPDSHKFRTALHAPDEETFNRAVCQQPNESYLDYVIKGIAPNITRRDSGLDAFRRVYYHINNWNPVAIELHRRAVSEYDAVPLPALTHDWHKGLDSVLDYLNHDYDGVSPLAILKTIKTYEWIIVTEPDSLDTTIGYSGGELIVNNTIMRNISQFYTDQHTDGLYGVLIDFWEKLPVALAR